MQLFSMCLFEINHAFQENEIPEHNTVPLEYHDFLDLLSGKEAKEHQSHMSYNHKISLLLGMKPLFRSLYGMLKLELEVLKEYIEYTLNKFLIRHR